MRGAPQSGFSRLIVRIQSRTSCGTAGLPGFPDRIFPVQNSRKPFRCQPMTVAGRTRKTLECQSFHTVHNQAQKKRSAEVSFGRLTERCRTPIWWRNARISNCRAVRLRKEAKTEVRSAEKRGPKGNCRKTDKPQCINRLEFTRTTEPFRRVCVGQDYNGPATLAWRKRACSIWRPRPR